VYGFPGERAGVAPGAMGANAYDAWKPESNYDKMFEKSKISQSEGTVKSVGTFYPEDGAAPGLRLRVQTESGDVMIVHAGPVAYAQSQKIDFHSGDRVKLSGAQAEFQGRTVLLANEISKDGQKLTLRDSEGRPAWNVDQLQKSTTPEPPPAAGEEPGR